MKESTKIAKQLKPKHLAFAIEYLSNGNNGLQAYTKIYTKASQHTATTNASKLLRHDGIKAYIEATNAELNDYHQFTQLKIVEIRHNIATDDEQRAADRLTACRDQEKSQGWQAPTQVEVNHKVHLIDAIRGNDAALEAYSNVTNSMSLDAAPKEATIELDSMDDD